MLQATKKGRKMPEPTERHPLDLAAAEAQLNRTQPGPENVSSDCLGMCSRLPEALRMLREYALLVEGMPHEEDCENNRALIRPCDCIRGRLLAVVGSK